MGSSTKRKGKLISLSPNVFDNIKFIPQFELFTELARIFSEDNNASAQRTVLWREGTAKIADTVGENDRHLQKVFQKQVCRGFVL